MKSKTVKELADLAEDLKCEIWEYLDVQKKTHKDIKSTMNELLDLIEGLDDTND